MIAGAHFDPDLTRLLDATDQVAREVVAAHAEAVDREARWPRESLGALQSAGLGGLVVPRDCGGHAQGLLALARVCETIARECPSTALCYGMHCVGTAVVSAHATPSQKERYLAPIAAGRHLTTLALSEPGTGAHFYVPRTQMVPAGAQAFRLSGTKCFVTNGGYADSYVVSAAARATQAPMGHFSCVLVPADAEGLEWGPPWDGLGMRGNASRSVKLNRVRVSRALLLGKEGDEIWYVFNVVAPYFLVAMAGTYLGIAERALAEATARLGERAYDHSGSLLGDAPVLQHRLGWLWGLVERTRRLVYHAAASFDRGEPDALPAVMAAKAEVADCVIAAVNEAMTLCGGVAYREGSTLQRLLRDARAAHVMAPTTDILRLWIGRTLLQRPLLGD
jgi:alkylation response protein AidB-like acyl-CoA dehydrogenase